MLHASSAALQRWIVRLRRFDPQFMTQMRLPDRSPFRALGERSIATIRLLIRTTHNLAGGARAAGLTGLGVLRTQLAGQTVAVLLSGSNIAAAPLRRVLTDEIE